MFPVPKDRNGPVAKWGFDSGMSSYTEDMIRKRLRFYGQVQGVGFRYRAEHAARIFSVTGWVRNDPDGAVTMEIQGTEEQIDQVIQSIERGIFVRVDAMDAKSIPVIADESVFSTDE